MPKRHKIRSEHQVAFSSLTMGGDNHEEFRQAVIKAARENVAEMPNLLDDLGKLLRERTPEGILTTFGFYGSQGTIGPNGELRSLAKGILQHHIELLQALVLTIPVDEWGVGPPTADIMQTVFDTVPKLADIFVQTRIVQRVEEGDPQKQAVMSLQEKIRLHTQAVRNWGYYNEVIAICRELYAPLDSKFAASLGFSISDLLDVSDALVKEVERRSSQHMSQLAKVFKGNTVEQLVRLYYKHMPGIEGSPEDFLKIVPKGTLPEGVKGRLLSHADLRHLDTMSFTVAQVAELTGKPEAVVKGVLDGLSRKPGDLVGTQVQHLFLANPVWLRPGINFGPGYIFALPQAIFSHINEIIRQLAGAAKLEDTLSDRRAAYLEDKTADVLQTALPTARITKNAKWTVGDTPFETDVIAVVDRTLIIAEAKSHRVTPQGLRGAPDSLKHHLTDLVVNPSIQSERLATLVGSARSGDVSSQAIVARLNIDPQKIDHIVRVSITLDDLSVLSSAEDELKNVGWIPAGHDLAPSLHIADLACIAGILGNEILFLHYFAERFHFQKAFELLGDELDFLGLYLSTGFNLGPTRENFKRMMITGMSEPIDRYYEAQYVGLKVPKPRANLYRVYREIVERLALRKPDGWSTIGIHLLNSASPDEQKKVGQGLQRLRKAVKKNANAPGRECFMEIIPALDRKATIGFYVYPEAMKPERRKNMEQLAAGALEREEATTCVVFGKNSDRWSEPYEVVLFAQKQALPARQ